MSRSLPPFYRDPFFWLVLLLAIPATAPLLEPGYFWGAHDARHSAYFLYEFDKVFREGVLWPRWGWGWGFGYGYPFWNIYGPLSIYFGQAFHMLGFEIVDAVKISFGASAILSGLTMYLFARKLFGRLGGLISALVYVYFPYHLFDLYVRAALAESFGFVFVPLVFWGFYELLVNPRLKVIALTGLAFAALMLSSNLLAFLITPILGIWTAVHLLYHLRRDHGAEGALLQPGRTALKLDRLRSLLRTTAYPLAGLIMGLGLSAIFVLPAMTEVRFVRVDQWVGGRYAFGEDWVEFFQLFSPRWGFGASIPGPDDDAGFQLGLLPLILFLVSFLSLSQMRRGADRLFIRFLQIASLVVIFLMTPASELIWRVVPLTSIAQFPWRLLAVAGTTLSIVSGSVFAGESRMPPRRSAARYRTAALLASLIILASYPYIQAEVRDPKPTEGPVGDAALFRFQQSSDEMTGSTAWTQRIPRWSPLAEQVIRGGTIDTRVNYGALPEGKLGVHSLKMGPLGEVVWFHALEEGLEVPFLIPYYPGWTAYLYEDLGPSDADLESRMGRRLAILPLNTTPREGWMQVPVPQGAYFLELRFVDTPVRVAGKVISALSVLGVVILLIIDRQPVQRRPKTSEVDYARA